MVVEQSPQAGALVPYRTRVRLVVQPEETTTQTPDVVVPSVLDRTADEAREALEVVGLVPQLSGSGTVVTDQAPTAGASVPPGSPVRVVLATGSGGADDGDEDGGDGGGVVLDDDDEPASGTPLTWWVAVGTLALLGAGATGAHLVRRRARSWVGHSVDLVPHRSRPSVRSDVRPGTPTLCVTVEPHSTGWDVQPADRPPL